MLKYPVRIRFVGGPWHNRVEAVQALTPTVFISGFSGDTRYHLAQYISAMGTTYYQYVHSSLVSGTHVSNCTHRERLAVWRLDQKKLEAQLRNRIKRSAPA